MAQRTDLTWTVFDVLSRRDPLRSAMGQTLRQDRPKTRYPDRATGPHTLDGLLWSFSDLPRACSQQVPGRSSKWQHRRLEICPRRNQRRYQRRTGLRLHADRLVHWVHDRVCSPQLGYHA
jgi:hypothetical protein